MFKYSYFKIQRYVYVGICYVSVIDFPLWLWISVPLASDHVLAIMWFETLITKVETVSLSNSIVIQWSNW